MTQKQLDNSLISDLSQLWHYLSRRRRIQLGLLLLLLVVASLSEMVSLGAIFPFLSALNNANVLLQTSWLQPIMALFQIHTTQQLVQASALGFIISVVLACGCVCLLCTCACA